MEIQSIYFLSVWQGVLIGEEYLNQPNRLKRT